MQNIIVDKKHEAYEVLKAMQKICDYRKKYDGKKKAPFKSYHFIHFNGEAGRFEATDGRVLLTYYWTPEELKDGPYSVLFSFINGELIDSKETFYFPKCDRVIPSIGGEYNGYSERYENFYEITPYEFGNICPADYRLCTVLGSYGITINGKYAELVKEIIPRFDYITTAIKTDGHIHTENCRPVMLHGGGLEYIIMPLVPSWNNLPLDVPERTKKGA